MDGRRMLIRLYGWVFELTIALFVFTCVWLAAVLVLHRGPLFVLGTGTLLWLALRVGVEAGWWLTVRLIRWGQERVGPH